MEHTEQDVVILDTLRTVKDYFAVKGQDVRLHKGRSVVSIMVDGRRHFLKRYWLAPSQIVKRHVTRGMHELAMIDWLNENGFAGPKVVRRGHVGRFPVFFRAYFLMEEVSNEWPFATAYRRPAVRPVELLSALATFAARLHDAHFVHTDFSERHILVGHNGERSTFRLIDVERARLGCLSEQSKANDLATLVASVLDEDLRRELRGRFVEDYVAARRNLKASVDFRACLEKAQPTRLFFKHLNRR